MSVNQNIKLKSLKLTAILLLSPLFIFAQLLTGLWTGVLSNDSNSIRKDQSYEVALTEYRGKVFGYSRTEFIVHDTLYYIVKRVRGVVDGDTCEVKDDDILSYNFPGRPDKRVKVSSFFYRDKKDSTWHLSGKWKTNKTKEYYSVAGKLDLKEEKDLSNSKLFPHLEELNLTNEVAFYQDWKKEKAPVVMKVVEPENKSTADGDMANNKSAPNINGSKENSSNKEETTTSALIIEPEYKPVIVSKPVPREETLLKIDASPTKKDALVSSAPSQKEGAKMKITETSTGLKPGASEMKPGDNELQSAAIKIDPRDVKKESSVTTKKESLTSIPAPETKKPVVNSNTVVSSPPAKINTEPKKPDAAIANVPAGTITSPGLQPTVVSKVNSTIVSKEINTDDHPNPEKLPNVVLGRKSEFSQFVNFKSDSLQLSLYDNGEIDGDTVTVFLNGQILLEKQGLKATAIKKTIYLVPGKDDEFTLVLFADNLGKYPPNTGLLVVHDGDDVYNVRFSADFQTNAGVLFKRKKN